MSNLLQISKKTQVFFAENNFPINRAFRARLLFKDKQRSGQGIKQTRARSREVIT